MEVEKIADILLNMSLDMDYADALDYYDAEVKTIKNELESLGKDSSLYNALECIAMSNCEMFQAFKQ